MVLPPGKDKLFPDDCGRQDDGKGKLCFGDPELCRQSEDYILFDTGEKNGHWCIIDIQLTPPWTNALAIPCNNTLWWGPLVWHYLGAGFAGAQVANRRFLLKPLQNIDLTYHRVFTHKGVSILRKSMYITYGRTVGEGNMWVRWGGLSEGWGRHKTLPC